MKRQNIELVLGFLDAIRRRDREAAARLLDPAIVWQGVVPELACHGPNEVLDVFLSQRDQEIEVDGLELIGAQEGAIFAVRRPDTHQIAGVEIHGVMYHACAIEEGKITKIEDYAKREQALAAAGLGDG